MLTQWLKRTGRAGGTVDRSTVGAEEQVGFGEGCPLPNGVRFGEGL